MRPSLLLSIQLRVLVIGNDGDGWKSELYEAGPGVQSREMKVERKKERGTVER